MVRAVRWLVCGATAWALVSPAAAQPQGFAPKHRRPAITVPPVFTGPAPKLERFGERLESADRQRVAAYASSQNPAEAKQFFRSFDDPPRMIRALYDEYVRRGEVDKALTVLVSITLRCDVLVPAVRVASLSSHPTLGGLTDNVMRAGGCGAFLTRVLAASARLAHRTAIRTRAVLDVDRAIRLYDRHLKQTKRTKRLERAWSRYLRAEALWLKAEIEVVPAKARFAWLYARSELERAADDEELPIEQGFEAFKALELAAANYRAAAHATTSP